MRSNRLSVDGRRNSTFRGISLERAELVCTGQPRQDAGYRSATGGQADLAANAVRERELYLDQRSRRKNHSPPGNARSHHPTPLRKQLDVGNLRRRLHSPGRGHMYRIALSPFACANRAASTNSATPFGSRKPDMSFPSSSGIALDRRGICAAAQLLDGAIDQQPDRAGSHAAGAVDGSNEPGSGATGGRESKRCRSAIAAGVVARTTQRNAGGIDSSDEARFGRRTTNPGVGESGARRSGRRQPACEPDGYRTKGDPRVGEPSTQDRPHDRGKSRFRPTFSR